MLDRKAELDSLVLTVTFATDIAADQVPDEFTWCKKDGVNYCTEKSQPAHSITDGVDLGL